MLSPWRQLAHSSATLLRKLSSELDGPGLVVYKGAKEDLDTGDLIAVLCTTTMYYYVPLCYMYSYMYYYQRMYVLLNVCMARNYVLLISMRCGCLNPQRYGTGTTSAYINVKHYEFPSLADFHRSFPEKLILHG